MGFSFIETGGGAPLHFAHANGFPPGVYMHIFNMLAASGFRVLALNQCSITVSKDGRACGKSEFAGWRRPTNELIAFLESAGAGPVIGVGHSYGGVITMLAAAERPQLFKKIVLLDPVFLDPRLVRFIAAARIIGMELNSPLAERAKKRRNGWKSRDEANEYFRSKSMFSNWEDAALESYMSHGLKETDCGVELACPPEMEALIFSTYPTRVWRVIRKRSVPTLIARGEKSEVISDRTWNTVRKIRPNARFIEFAGLGHLFPMQDAAATVRSICDFSAG